MPVDIKDLPGLLRKIKETPPEEGKSAIVGQKEEEALLLVQPYTIIHSISEKLITEAQLWMMDQPFYG